MKIIDKLIKFTKKVNKDKSNRETLIKKLNEIGNVMRNRRLELNMSKKELSDLTRISLAVIKALEDGDYNSIPGRPFIKSILSKIEKEIKLEKGLLLEKLVDKNDIYSMNTSGSNINKNYVLFKQYFGNFTYIFFMLLTILILNKLNLSRNTIEYRYMEPSPSEKLILKD